ncbi:MAG: hypothetical protein ACOX7L_07335 [Dethiobacteria bacterium]
MAAKKVKAKFKYLDGPVPRKVPAKGAGEPLLHPGVSAGRGFAYLDRCGCIAIHSKYFLAKQYRRVIARAIGIDEGFLVSVHSKTKRIPPPNYFPIVEAILGLAYYTTGRPVILGSNKFPGKNGSFM